MSERRTDDGKNSGKNEQPEDHAPSARHVEVGGEAFQTGMDLSVTDAHPSGRNGPVTAHAAMQVGIEKPGWKDGTTAVGEIDGLNVGVRQGGAGSDASGILVNIAGTGEGFINGMEMAVTRVRPNSNETTDYVNQQIGIISGNQIFGYHVNLHLKEEGKVATAYHASGEQSWDLLFDSATFRVDGSGNVITHDGNFITDNGRVYARDVVVHGRVYLDADDQSWVEKREGKILIGSGDTVLLSLDPNGNLAIRGELQANSDL